MQCALPFFRVSVMNRHGVKARAVTYGRKGVGQAERERAEDLMLDNRRAYWKDSN